MATLWGGLRVAVVVTLAVAGCSDGDSGGTAGPEVAICDKVVNECRGTDDAGIPITMPECLESFGVMQLPEGCVDAVEAATCVELDTDGAAVDTACFPPCTAAPAQCQAGGTIWNCYDGRTIVARCSDLCTAQGYAAWSGVCAAEYQGRPSSTGESVCWCR